MEGNQLDFWSECEMLRQALAQPESEVSNDGRRKPDLE